MIGGHVAARRLLAISCATIALQAVTFAARGEPNRDWSILVFLTSSAGAVKRLIFPDRHGDIISSMAATFI